jgi:hypothetical protein
LPGEHQDYLGLPVIAAAIACASRPWRVVICALHSSSRPGQDVDFIGNQRLPYLARDYFRSGFSASLDRFSSPWRSSVRSAIPMKAPPPALRHSAAWIKFL